MNIVDIAIKSIVVTVFGLGLFAMMRRGSAATRHYFLALTLFSLCALPLVAPVLPRWSVPFIRIQTPSVAPAPALAAPVESVKAVPAPVQDADLPSVRRMDPETAILILWGSIVTLLALRVATRLGRLRRLERSLPMCAQPELQSLVAEYCRRHKRHFLLLEGESNEPPMTWGHGRPVLLLPSSARQWPTDRLRSVMLHELAHVERGDWIVSLTSEIVCALFWFNPLVWVVRKRLEIESEHAADEWVVSMGVSRTDYATHLVELLRDLNRFPKAADAAVGMTRPGRLDARVKAILLERRPERPVRGSASIGLIAVASLLLVGVGAAGPTLVHPTASADLSLTKGSDTELLAQAPDFDPLLEAPAPSRSSQTANLLALAERKGTSHRKDGGAKPTHTVSATPSPAVSTARSPLVTVASGGHTSARAAGSASASSGDPGDEALGDVLSVKFDEAFDGKNFEAKMQRFSKEVDKSVAQIEKEAQLTSKKSVNAALNSVCKIDLPALIGGAMQAAHEGMAGTKLTKKQREQIQKQIEDSMKKAMDSVPDSDH